MIGSTVAPCRKCSSLAGLAGGEQGSMMELVGASSNTSSQLFEMKETGSAGPRQPLTLHHDGFGTGARLVRES